MTDTPLLRVTLLSWFLTDEIAAGCPYPGCRSATPHHSPHLIEAAYIEGVRAAAHERGIREDLNALRQKATHCEPAVRRALLKVLADREAAAFPDVVPADE